MKKTLLSLAVTAALGMVSGTASAANVGGVVWNPSSILDFTTTDSMFETAVNTVGQVVSGYGIINSLNGTNAATFCPGCELTYKFTGYTLISTAGGQFTFSGGTIQVFVDSTPDFSSLSANSAGDGVLWLSLAGRNHIDQGTGNIGTLHSDPTPAGVGIAGDGRGFLDVIGGLAAANFDTNTVAMVNPGGSAGFTDFQFTSSFQLLPGGVTFLSDDGKTYGLFGSNDFQGRSIDIPEPGSLALLGLGLVGLAGARRRSKSA
jgi:PEP-CTERM motif